jgi:hypothetical protein
MIENLWLYCEGKSKLDVDVYLIKAKKWQKEFKRGVH